jgi:hypothetical protein
MVEPDILPDLEVDVNENFERRIDHVRGGLIRRSWDLVIKEVGAFCHYLVN